MAWGCSRHRRLTSARSFHMVAKRTCGILELVDHTLNLGFQNTCTGSLTPGEMGWIGPQGRYCTSCSIEGGDAGLKGLITWTDSTWASSEGSGEMAASSEAYEGAELTDRFPDGRGFCWGAHLGRAAAAFLKASPVSCPTRLVCRASRRSIPSGSCVGCSPSREGP